MTDASQSRVVSFTSKTREVLEGASAGLMFLIWGFGLWMVGVAAGLHLGLAGNAVAFLVIIGSTCLLPVDWDSRVEHLEIVTIVASIYLLGVGLQRSWPGPVLLAFLGALALAIVGPLLYSWWDNRGRNVDDVDEEASDREVTV